MRRASQVLYRPGRGNGEFLAPRRGVSDLQKTWNLAIEVGSATGGIDHGFCSRRCVLCNRGRWLCGVEGAVRRVASRTGHPGSLLGTSSGGRLRPSMSELPSEQTATKESRRPQDAGIDAVPVRPGCGPLRGASVVGSQPSGLTERPQARGRPPACVQRSAATDPTDRDTGDRQPTAEVPSAAFPGRRSAASHPSCIPCRAEVVDQASVVLRCCCAWTQPSTGGWLIPPNPSPARRWPSAAVSW